MPTAEVLRQRRDRAEKRDRKVEARIGKQEVSARELAEEIDEERSERDELEQRRQEITKALAEEAELDRNKEGLKGDEWEQRKADKRDELADLIDASQARIDRLVKRALADSKLLTDLKQRDGKLDDRIDRLTKQIKAIKANPPGQLTKSFHVREFDCRNGVPVPGYMAPHLKALCVAHLQPLRDSGGVVSINSGYRTAAYNASIGGASQSYHIYDLRKKAPAADHIQAGRSAGAVQAWHEAHDRFDGMGFYAGFTHGDDRGYLSRWYGAS